MTRHLELNLTSDDEEQSVQMKEIKKERKDKVKKTITKKKICNVEMIKLYSRIIQINANATIMVNNINVI